MDHAAGTIIATMSHHCHSGSSVCQTLDELDFERGIWFAAQYGDLERVRKLLSQRTSVDVRDKSGYTALHYAARGGHLDVCKVLLANGADINAVTKSGQATALHRAASAGTYTLVNYSYVINCLLSQDNSFFLCLFVCHKIK